MKIISLISMIVLVLAPVIMLVAGGREFFKNGVRALGCIFILTSVAILVGYGIIIYKIY
ncbi:MAG: hypothetical protein V4699_01700 [Patescibacteria group bacterium]